MKKFIFSAMSAIALMGVSANANAATYSPTGTWTISGSVTASLGSLGTYPCPISINATTTSSSMKINSITMGGFCSVATLHNAPYTASYSGTATSGTLNIPNVRATGPLGIDCSGPLNGAWLETGTTSTVTFTGATLTGAAGSPGNCTFSGTLTATATGGTPNINP
ncbi:hypothetical protein SAMN06295912_12011 [Sphingomonas laterariae]|uniref:Protein activator of alkane oxidation PraB n=1 Tax=Edaphosphingomonas laterariae TaxID=861865 RepID=A0A239HY76_9SPHN|nr:hypothetical protein [Sphingomonas laterariae]SNS86416.1 hypothetical protein SAMN06295912_12011 [Sphingomonas laterariae]